jgi:two-component sensor histidine kinase
MRNEYFRFIAIKKDLIFKVGYFVLKAGLTLICVIAFQNLDAQSNNNLDSLVNRYLEQAKHYSDLGLYPKSAAEYKEAIELVKIADDTLRLIEIKIAYAELLRKSREVSKALEIIESLHIPETELLLRVKMLDRKAAILSEMDVGGELVLYDSVRAILPRAIALAEKGGFELQLASLKNHWGHQLSADGNPIEGQVLLLEAAHIYWSEKDTQNYVVTKNNIALNLIESGDYEHAFKLLDSLRNMIKGMHNYRLEIDIFNQTSYCFDKTGDQLNQVVWKHEAAKSFVKYNNEVHNKQMAAFKAQYENEKFQEIADQKSAALEDEKALQKRLLIFLMLSIILALIVASLLFREIGLKKKIKKINVDLQKANDRYQMLIIESNHRIKNNLQMVISMINFSSRNEDEKVKLAFKRINKSIFTIAALHKHLYPDVHKERVDLKIYCDEIIKTYRDVTADGFSLEYELESVEMKGERVVYFGLVLNELLSNSIEHGNKSGLPVKISIKQKDDAFQFEYEDGSSWQTEVKKGLGIGLIELLVKSAKGFDYQLDQSKGRYTFRFKV